jgi:starvation-inducible DNA-binding protein
MTHIETKRSRNGRLGSQKTALHPTLNDLPQAVRASMIALLNARLADAVDLYTQVKQAHWNVKGPNFIALHKLFDKLAEQVKDYVDTIAERAVQLGGTAMGTARIAAEYSSLPEYPHDITAGTDHVKALARSVAAFGAAVRAAIDTAGDADDMGTADLFTEVSRGVDEYLWFVEAHAQGRE